MRTRIVLLVLAMSIVSVLAAKATLTGPLATPAHWTSADEKTLLTELAASIKEVDAKDSRYRARAAALQLRAGMTTEAETNFKEAFDLDRNDNETCIIIANAYSSMKMYLRADDWYRRGTYLDPKDVDHQVAWGVSYFNRGDKAKAAEIFTKALSASPGTARLYNRIGEGISK